MFRISCILAMAIAGTSGALPVKVSAMGGSEAEPAMGRLLQQHLRRPGSVSEYRERILNVAAEMDFDGAEGLSVTDYAMIGLSQRAGARSAELGKFLASALDGDGAVSAAEAAHAATMQVVPAQRAGKEVSVEEMAAKVMDADQNSDGVVTIAEYNSRPGMPGYALVARSSLTWMELFARFDVNGDGVTMPEEIGAAFDAVVPLLDPDNDGEITDAETTAFFDRIKAEGQYKPEPTLMPLIEEAAARLP